MTSLLLPLFVSHNISTAGIPSVLRLLSAPSPFLSCLLCFPVNTRRLLPCLVLPVTVSDGRFPGTRHSGSQPNVVYAWCYRHHTTTTAVLRFLLPPAARSPSYRFFTLVLFSLPSPKRMPFLLDLLWNADYAYSARSS